MKEQKKTHWKKAYKSDYLGASDIDAELQVTIREVVFKECKLATGRQMCNVAIFTDNRIKPMILNVTNSKIIKKFAKNSPYIEDWKGINVSIYVDRNVRFGKDTVEGLRIRSTQPDMRVKLKEVPADKIDNLISFIKSGKKTLEEMKKIYLITPEIQSKIKEGLKDE